MVRVEEEAQVLNLCIGLGAIQAAVEKYLAITPEFSIDLSEWNAQQKINKYQRSVRDLIGRVGEKCCAISIGGSSPVSTVSASKSMMPRSAPPSPKRTSGQLKKLPMVTAKGIAILTKYPNGFPKFPDDKGLSRINKIFSPFFTTVTPGKSYASPRG